MMVSVGLAPVPVGNGRAVDDVEVLDLVCPAPSVEHRGGRIVAHPRRAVLVRAVAGDPVGIDLLDRRGAAASRMSALRSIRKRPWSRSFSCGFRVIARDRQAPGVDHLVVEVDAVVVLRHVVQHHGDRHASG